MTTSELEQLRAIVGREYVQGEGLAREYAVAGRAPEAVAEPQNVQELCSLVRLASEAGWAVIPWGGATQMALGAAPARYHLAIPLRRLNRVVDYQPDDMTVTVQGGVPLDSLSRTFGERGQFLPLDPPLPQRATAGGTVATAASGPLRAAYGTPRDWFLGAAVVDAAGEVVRPGGRVVKNVAGYDLCKLYTGSHGTLGILAELTFKVMPRPAAWGYSAVALRSAEQAEELVARVQDSDTAPAALELVNANAWETVAGASLAPERFLLAAVFAGDEEAVAWQQASLEGIAGQLRLRAHAVPALQAEVWFRGLRDYPARPGLVLRLSARSSSSGGLCAAVEERAAGWGLPVGLVAHAASGVVWARFGDAPAAQVPEMVAALRGAAAAREGHLFVHRAPVALEGALDVWGPPPPGFRLMEGIKRRLDPRGVLGPGRLVGGL